MTNYLQSYLSGNGYNGNALMNYLQGMNNPVQQPAQQATTQNALYSLPSYSAIRSSATPWEYNIPMANQTQYNAYASVLPGLYNALAASRFSALTKNFPTMFHPNYENYYRPARQWGEEYYG